MSARALAGPTAAPPFGTTREIRALFLFQQAIQTQRIPAPWQRQHRPGACG